MLVGWLAYHRSGTNSSFSRWPLSALRVSAVALLMAMLFGAPIGRSSIPDTIIAIDASQSWMRAVGDESTAVRMLRQVIRDSILPAAGTVQSTFLLGDSLRGFSSTELDRWYPSDSRSLVAPAVDRARALGAALYLVTDGDIEDPNALRDVPAGSQAVVLPRTQLNPRPDVGVVDIEGATTTVSSGDSVAVTVTLQTGGAATAAGRLALLLDGVLQQEVPIPPLAAYSGTRLSGSVRIQSNNPSNNPSNNSTVLLSAVAKVAADAESRNDTLTVAIDVRDQPAVVAISTAPDLDWREALTVLRNGLGLSVRAYIRVAPGLWRVEGSFSPVGEAEVRRHALGAGMLVLHGDTSLVKPSTTGRTGSRVLWVPAPVAAPARPGEINRPIEWYVSGVPVSPLSAALAGLPLDSLPPVALAERPPLAPEVRSHSGKTSGRGAQELTPILTAKLEKSGPETPVILASEGVQGRSVEISGSGYAGWALRGGRAQQAFMALFGSVFDWAAAGRGDDRIIRPVGGVIREGDPIKWRRGGADTLIRVQLTRVEASSTTPKADSQRLQDSVTLVFGEKHYEALSGPLKAGLYRVRASNSTGPSTGNGASNSSILLVVNEAREWVPSAPSLQTGRLAERSTGIKPPSRRLVEYGWPFVVALVLLSIEWLGRRSVGQP